jgi:hypothetical protein
MSVLFILFYGSVNMWFLMIVFSRLTLQLRGHRSKTVRFISRLSRFISRLSRFISRLGRKKFPVRPATGIGSQGLDRAGGFRSRTAPAEPKNAIFPVEPGIWPESGLAKPQGP